MNLDIEPSPEPAPTAALQARPSQSDGAEALPTEKKSSWREWLRQGLRATFGMRLSALPSDVQPAWLLSMFVMTSALLIGVRRLEIEGDALFSLAGWLYSWAGTGLVLTVLGWWFLVARRHWRHTSPVLAWLSLVWVSSAVMYVASGALTAWALYGRYPQALSTPNGRWTLFGVFVLWAAVAQWRAAQALLKHRGAMAALVLSVTAVNVISALWLRSSPWEYNYASEPPKPRLELSQSVFEQQQSLFRSQVENLLPSDGAKPQVYGLVYAPYEGDVFMRENQLVTGVMASRFGAEGRTLSLLNHATATATTPWATPTNLERALNSIGEKMNRDQDVLLLYLTSHGGRDHKLASEHWPLNVPELTAVEVRTMLDRAGIRYSAVLISACYSGGWIEPLQADTHLVMTAADKDHTSYGCGGQSELTFFGRAMFDEELRHSSSFEQAFARAVPRIKQREIEAGKDDGFSNPQLAVGPGFRAHWASVVQPVLDSTP